MAVLPRLAPYDGRACVQLHGMPEMVTGLAFTCDARALIAAGSDAALRMWDLTSGRVRHTLTGHVAKARSLTRNRLTTKDCMAPLLCGSAAVRLRLWELVKAQNAAMGLDKTAAGCRCNVHKCCDGSRAGASTHTCLPVPLQVCSVDCSPLQPNQAVSGGTDRCIKVGAA